MTVKLNTGDPGFAGAFERLLTVKRETAQEVDAVVQDIISDVCVRGDAAVLEYTERFDRRTLSAVQLRISADDSQKAIKACAPPILDALKLATDRIERFHREQLPKDLRYQDESGMELGYRWRPIDTVGLYVPGGLASYPSSVLMNAIPAQVAGVPRIVMVVPAPEGKLNPLVLAAASYAGVTEIYQIGGAQAIAALAYGTATIPQVDKVVGPGNAYVAAAKRQVYGQVGIDSIAGPSEILVVADSKNDPAWIAADLLSQAEHDPAAQSILITDNQDFAEAVEGAIENHLRSLSRSDIARASWQSYGTIIVVSSLKVAPDLINRIAPEHLEIAIEDPDSLAAEVRHAGAIFLGRYTPEAIGDYIAGPSHVLPTARGARFSSGLSVMDFMKRTSLMRGTKESLAVLGPPSIALAAAEGLPAHALSIKLRLKK
ncbi:MAG: histidinol dehydrogenase [Alphaproteobacteria bacterium]